MPSISREIKPKSALHKRIANAIDARFKLSKNKMTTLHKKWRQSEEQVLAYLPEKDVDALRRAEREQSGVPNYTTLSIPYSYAVLMTAHTYWTSVFLSRSPILQFQARHGEPKGNVQAVDALMDYQVHVGEMLVPFYIWLLDVGKYGVGIIGNYWEEEKRNISRIEEEEEMFFGMIPTGKKVKKKITETVVGYQGNKNFNVRPYDWFPDPRVPIQRFQEGEFCGRKVSMGWNEVVRRAEKGEFFNIEFLRKKKEGAGYNEMYSEGTAQLEYPTDEQFSDEELRDVGFRDFVEMTVELVPTHWGLGSSKYPEKWVFTITMDMDLIVGARPLGAYHDKYPFDVIELEPEGYALSNRSMMDTLRPLQNVMDWLVNSHFYNVRKTLNNQIVVDPSKVNMSDVYNPMPGGVWRLKPQAYGTDVKTVYSQVQMTDVTQNHLRDSQIVGELIQRVSGVTENIMGMVNPGGRKTATEVRTSSSFSANRLKTQSEYFSAMGFSPMSQKMLQNTQQYYSLEKQFKIAGDLMQTGMQEAMTITPETIKGFYDFVPVDGTLPVDRFAQANLWRGLLSEMQRYPQILQEYDISAIFAWVAQLAGLKNINQFKIEVAPDNVLAEQARQGNLVAYSGGKGGGQSGTTGGGQEDPERVAEPGQLEGMGTTG